MNDGYKTPEQKKRVLECPNAHVLRPRKRMVKNEYGYIVKDGECKTPVLEKRVLECPRAPKPVRNNRRLNDYELGAARILFNDNLPPRINRLRMGVNGFLNKEMKKKEIVMTYVEYIHEIREELLKSLHEINKLDLLLR